MLSRFCTIRERDRRTKLLYQYRTSEILSVCPSVKFRYCIETKSYALYPTVTFPMTLSDLWRSFRWPTYCCYFVCTAYARSVSDS